MQPILNVLLFEPISSKTDFQIHALLSFFEVLCPMWQFGGKRFEISFVFVWVSIFKVEVNQKKRLRFWWWDNDKSLVLKKNQQILNILLFELISYQNDFQMHTLLSFFEVVYLMWHFGAKRFEISFVFVWVSIFKVEVNQKKICKKTKSFFKIFNFFEIF